MKLATLVACTAVFAVGCDSARRGVAGGTGGGGTPHLDAGVFDVGPVDVGPEVDGGGAGPDVAADGGTVADGSSSTLDRTKRLDALSPAELAAMCAELQALVPAGIYDCDGVRTTIVSETECRANVPMVACSVDLVLSCFESLGGDPCRLGATTECAAYLECITGG